MRLPAPPACLTQTFISSYQVGRMRAASLRLGSQGLKSSYGDHIMICGDAAGHIDPITGEGIHTGMMVRANGKSPLFFALSSFVPGAVSPALLPDGIVHQCSGLIVALPLSSLPLHYTQAAKAAAETIADMVKTGDFSAASARPYYDKWQKDFGYDFAMVSGRAMRHAMFSLRMSQHLFFLL